VNQDLLGRVVDRRNGEFKEKEGKKKGKQKCREAPETTEKVRKSS